MKSLLTYAVVLAMLSGCSKKKNDPGENVQPEPVLKKEEVMTNLSRNPYQIAEWYSVSGKDTAFLNEDPLYSAIMEQIFPIFIDDKWVDYYTGVRKPNTVISGKADIFDLNVFYFRSLGLDFHWDEQEGTMVLTWTSKPDGLPAIFPDGVTLKMDKKGYRRVKTAEEAKAARTTGTMRFHYQYDGKDYTLVLKQMWGFADGMMPKHTLYVVF